MLRLYTHASCLQHDPGPDQPESSARLRAVLQALDQDRFAALDRIEAPRATREQLLRVHGAAHVERILATLPESGTVRLDEDTLMSPGSAEAATGVAAGVAAAAAGSCARRSRRRRLSRSCGVMPPQIPIFSRPSSAA